MPGRAGRVAVAIVFGHGALALLPKAFLGEGMPLHNPEHSCPDVREVDWPTVKADVLDYALRAEGSRRGYASSDAAYDWRTWVARVYVANDLDFCPVGVQAVHITDVDHRLAEYDAQALGDIFESQYEVFLSKIPLMLVLLSGWPIFRLYAQIADAARGLPDFVPGSSLQGICGGAVALGDALHLIHGILGAQAPASAGHLLVPLARVLTGVEVSASRANGTGRGTNEWIECKLMASMAHFARAVLLGNTDATRGSREGVEVYFGKIVGAVEAGEATLHQAVQSVLRRPPPAQGAVHVFASGWPMWKLLDQLQAAFARPPWSLACRGSKIHATRDRRFICPACAVPQQTEWFRETQWVSRLVAAGARGEMGGPPGGAPKGSAPTELENGATIVPAVFTSAAAGSGGDDGDEAWATLLSDDDAQMGQSSEVLHTYVEAVRVMARSVRSVECGAGAGDAAADACRQRPFLVLITAATLTAEIDAVLRGDGLSPLVLPSFGSEGVDVPKRLSQRGDAAAGPAELSWWMKIRLWGLTQYRRIVYLDADVLVRRPVEELFALPREVTFAAPVHQSRDGKGAEVSVGVMSLRPCKEVYDAMVDFLMHAAPRLQTGVRSVDQMLQHTFFAHWFKWHGYPSWDRRTGRFLGCAAEGPRLREGVNLDIQGKKDTLGTICTLPPWYDFCISYPALVAAQESRDLQDELAVQFIRPGAQREAGSWRHALFAKVLHWTGPRRKPWLHWLPLARTPFDDLWWGAHAEMCHHTGGSNGSSNAAYELGDIQVGYRVSPRPCRIQCDDL